MVCGKIWFLKFSVAGKCSKCLKYAVLSKMTVSQVSLKLFSCNLFLNSGESHVVVTSFTHIHSGLQQNAIFQIFSSWKLLKMLKISCFKQNQCISGKRQGMPLQFFAQQW